MWDHSVRGPGVANIVLMKAFSGSCSIVLVRSKAGAHHLLAIRIHVPMLNKILVSIGSIYMVCPKLILGPYIMRA